MSAGLATTVLPSGGTNCTIDVDSVSSFGTGVMAYEDIGVVDVRYTKYIRFTLYCDVPMAAGDIQFVMDNIDLMFKEHSFISKKNLSYYGSKYNSIFNMPDDVKDDWRDAIRGFVFDLKTDVRMRLENNEFELSGLAKLYKDLMKMEQEKFPTSVATRKTISDILKGIEDRERDRNK